MICRTPPQTADHTPLSGPVCTQPLFYVFISGSGEYTFSGFKAADHIFRWDIKVNTLLFEVCFYSSGIVAC